MKKRMLTTMGGALSLAFFTVSCNETLDVADLQTEGLDQTDQTMLNPAGEPTDRFEGLVRPPLINAGQDLASARNAGEWLTGDVFAGVASGKYNIFDNAGGFLEFIDNGQGGFTTGAAFNLSLDKLYTTTFSNGRVVVFDDAAPHNILQDIEADNGAESIVFAANGDFYVGHADGNRDIYRYNADGILQQVYDVATGPRGADWIDLASDQQTMYYTSEGTDIYRYDVVNDVQLPNFVTGILTGGPSYALRLLAPGDGSGGLIVANSADIKRLDGAGNVVQTYDVTGVNGWFAVNLDPNGTSFWGSSFVTNDIYRFNINTGALEAGPIASGGSNFGLAVKGELTAVDPILAVPMDIKPEGCPNPLNVSSKGLLPVAILGTEDFDVTEIDLSTVALEGVPVFKSSMEDVSTPVADAEDDCDCSSAGPDGLEDLTLKFKTQDIVVAIGDVDDGDQVLLTLSGTLTNGTVIEGKDCILIIKK